VNACSHRDGGQQRDRGGGAADFDAVWQGWRGDRQYVVGCGEVRIAAIDTMTVGLAREVAEEGLA